MKTAAFTETERIIHHLMLNTYFMPDSGLFHGQMGIALVMSKYSRHANNKIYFDVASYLLDNIMERISKNMNSSFAYGLSGIGWGIEYLIQNNFVEGESVEICEEIDSRIMETDPCRIADFSLENGFEGLLHYIIYHLQGAVKQKTQLPFDTNYLSDIYAVCKTMEEESISETLRLLVNVYASFMENKVLTGYDFNIVDFTDDLLELKLEELSTCPLGLSSGLAGVLLHSIVENKTIVKRA